MVIHNPLDEDIVYNPFEPDPPESLKERFYRLADRWRADPSSSIAKILQHPDYRAIITMGQDVVPLILREMAIKPGHWFVALFVITGENPIPEDCYGNLPKMTEHWLAWGKEHGLI